MYRSIRSRMFSKTLPQTLVLGILGSQTLLFVAGGSASALAAGASTAKAAVAAVGSATINEFRPAGISQTALTDPLGITTGPDGNLWFTDAGASKIAKITPSGTGLVEYSTKSLNATPVAITTGPDSRLWFAEFAGTVSQVGRITPSGATQNEFGMDKAGSLPTSIVTGPDKHLWFTNFGNGTIGTIDPAAAPGTIAKTFAITTPSLNPTAITSGPNGHLWFTQQGAGGGKIGEMTVAGVQVSDTQAAGTPGAGLAGITVGPDGNLWFTEQAHGRIGKMTPGHVVTEFAPLPGNGSPTAITAGSDGALWFIDQGNNAIGRITLTGAVTEYPVPTAHAFSAGVQPTGITSGPDGNIWFTEQDTKAAIGQLIVPPVGTGAVTASPAAIAFGSQKVGTSSAARSVTVTNNGPGSVTVSSATTSGPNAGDFPTADNCTGTTLAAGKTCKVTITFDPSDSGPRTAVLTVTETNGGSQLVALSGQGTGGGSGGGPSCDPGLLGLITSLLKLLGLSSC